MSTRSSFSGKSRAASSLKSTSIAVENVSKDGDTSRTHLLLPGVNLATFSIGDLSQQAIVGVVYVDTEEIVVCPFRYQPHPEIGVLPVERILVVLEEILR